VEKCTRILKQFARSWRTPYHEKFILPDIACLSPTPLSIAAFTVEQCPYVGYEIKGREPFRGTKQNKEFVKTDKMLRSTRK
jgi:hypothetical protein